MTHPTGTNSHSVPLKPWMVAALSFAAGLAVALVLDYILYRIGLPSKPFIYVAF